VLEKKAKHYSDFVIPSFIGIALIWLFYIRAICNPWFRLHLLLNLRNLHALWLQEREDRQTIGKAHNPKRAGRLCATSHGADIHSGYRIRTVPTRWVKFVFAIFLLPICHFQSDIFTASRRRP